MSNKIIFHKLEGAGNDFIIIDNREQQLRVLNPGLISRLCHRRFGIGADGLILLDRSATHDFSMHYWNADGYPAEMCGNGARCALWLAHEIGLAPQKSTFNVGDLSYEGRVLSDHLAAIVMPPVKTIMGPVALKDLFPEQRAMQWLNSGVPHLVIESDKDIETINLLEEGKRFRDDPLFSPGGVNVNFIQPITEGMLRARVYERGVEDETLACGTGAVACAVFAKDNWGWAEPLRIRYPGGELEVDLSSPGGKPTLTGPVRKVFSGEVSPDGFD